MDPVLGSVIGAALAALIAGGFAIRQTRILESERSKAASNTTAIESTRVQIDGWDRLTNSYRQEITRLQEALGEERAIAEAFARKADRLERERDGFRREVEFCRTNHLEDRPGD